MARIYLGIEKLLARPPAWLKNKRIGLLAHQASVDGRLTSSKDLLSGAGARLTALFSPQHGYWGEQQDNMVETPHRLDPNLGIPVFSLYGETRRPTPEMMGELDILLVDLQDVGCRVYTYIHTLAYCLMAADQYGKKVVILDRPNPLGGEEVEGPMLQEHLRSFVGLFPIPMRHGLTLGEMALYLKRYHGIGQDLEIIPLEGWKRKMLFPATGLAWVMPSPNMPAFETVLVYPGQVLWEGTNVSEGRGTTRPFELFGSPFFNPKEILGGLDTGHLPGLTFREVSFEPTFHKWQGRSCRGFQLHVTHPKIFKPFRTTLCLLSTILSLYPRDFAWQNPPYEYETERLPMDLLLGDNGVRRGLEEGTPVLELEAGWAGELNQFKDKCREIYLYED
jgi:uncharacterized protein YbbC (DUF1343 family)